jgi:hypothetical protein
MVFKFHILMIFILSIVAYMLWQGNQKQVQTQETEKTGIEIIHASFGLDCESAQTIPAIFIDNVKDRVQQECAGKKQCVIPISPKALGNVYHTQCFTKSLSIDYRCAPYEPRRSATAVSGALTINCLNER